MHETVVAQALLDIILAHAQKLGAKPVAARVTCGQLNPVNEEILNFAFEAAAGDSVCKGLKLTIEQVPLKATCEKCGQVFDFDIYSPRCVNCGSDSFTIAPDAPLLLEEIEFEDNTENENISE